MIVHTLIYRFPETVTDAKKEEFFAGLRELALGSGMVEAFDYKYHYWLPADARSSGITGTAIAVFTTKDLATLKQFSERPETYEFTTSWKKALGFDAAYANHDELDLSPALSH